MKVHDATENSYKNGYKQGYADAKAEIKYANKVRAKEPNHVVMTMQCDNCGAYVLEQDHVCAGCGAIFKGSVE